MISGNLNLFLLFTYNEIGSGNIKCALSLQYNDVKNHEWQL